MINKTFGNLKSSVVMAHTSAGKTKVYQYSNVNLSDIRTLPDVAVKAKARTSSIKNVTFPAMSITLFVMPKK